ncbi:hypothetical protein [Nocardia wallacei]|uniref:hypothetical protein n=1 Tax=Nocardia wallacei TaxID=480035 RepID=UPI002457C597|nr:hypothetical protein [Nocardia wallacei]
MTDFTNDPAQGIEPLIPEPAEPVQPHIDLAQRRGINCGSVEGAVTAMDAARPTVTRRLERAALDKNGVHGQDADWVPAGSDLHWG